ncbi:unannotated protein [freshwater metagenome]|uniref:Unannotated protein n=1 Tax=freshwater metagenome TaxID=449393 RepID=A0A6J7A7P2_9ZZZZ
MSLGNLTDRESFPNARPTTNTVVIDAGDLDKAIANLASRKSFTSSMVIAARNRAFDVALDDRSLRSEKYRTVDQVRPHKPVVPSGVPAQLPLMPPRK